MSMAENQSQQLEVYRGQSLATPGYKSGQHRNAHKKAYVHGYWRCGGCGKYLHPTKDADKIIWGNGKRAKYRYHFRCEATCKSARLRYQGRGAITRKERSLIVKRY